jgi:ABC-type branched-subunit amino acid transport system substrate-binding protein
LTIMIAQVAHAFEARGTTPLAGSPGALERLPRLPQGRLGRALDPWRVGLFVPTSGAAGIWGPSTIACAQLAAHELNRAGGIDGREVSLLVVDAASENAGLRSSAAELLTQRTIDAVVGMHLSSVRKALLPVLGGRLPYVYTPLYEGGERHPGVYTIGETPLHQLVPALTALSAERSPTRWALVGNDYVWPRVSHRYARSTLARLGCEVVHETFHPLGCDDYQPTVEQLERSGAQAVLLSLIGQDAIDFNRTFAARRLAGRIRRLSCAIEENELLAIGADSTEELYVAGAYFAALDTDANLAFQERYRTSLGARAPTLNALGQSTYEGVHFLRALLGRRGHPAAAGEPIPFCSARGAVWRGNDSLTCPIYLARASGHTLEVVRTLSTPDG